MTDVIGEITELESARGRALVAADWTALGELIADDVVHIHATGQIDDKAQYLASVSSKLEFIKVERATLNVRPYGDLAVATGVLHQTVRIKASGAVVDMKTITTQTWIRRSGRWVQNTFQATRLDA